MKKKEETRAEKIERAIRLAWESLESHLEYTHTPDDAGATFHKRAVKDYAEIIAILADLY
jgi:hypothetical protein